MDDEFDNVNAFVCVSFVPFLDISNSSFISPELLKSIVESPNPIAFGCLYDEKENLFSIIINHAEKLRDEMRNWSGGDDSYFQIHFSEGEEITDLIITPNVKISKDRFIKTLFNEYGKIVPEEKVFCVSKFIQCCWKTNANRTIAEMLHKKISSGEHLKTSFVEFKEVSNGAEEVVIYNIGNFVVLEEQPNLLQNPFIDLGEVN